MKNVLREQRLNKLGNVQGTVYHEDIKTNVNISDAVL